MALSLLVKKYSFSYDMFNRTFEFIDSWDLSDSLVEGVVIRKELESDDVFNFIVPSTNISIIKNSTLLTEFTKENFENYIYAVEIGIVGPIKINTRFAGEIEKTSVVYDVTQEEWNLNCRGWYKFFYDWFQTIPLALPDGVQLTDLETYLDTMFGISGSGLLTSKYVDADQSTTSWSDDVDINRIIEEEIMTQGEFLDEVVKHYGAFIDIDGNRRLNFINRAQRRGSTTTIDLRDEVLDGTRTQTYYRDAYYDGILISQKTSLGGGLYEISWKLLQYIKGVLEVTTVTNADNLGSIHGIKILDLRQQLGVTTSDEVTYTRVYDMDYHVFPQRSFSQTANDYRDLFQRPRVIDAEIDLDLSVDLLNPVQFNYEHSDGTGSIITFVEYLEEHLTEEKMVIKGKEHSGLVLPSTVDG